MNQKRQTKADNNKKSYDKPKIERVRLAVENPILGICDVNSPTVATSNCNVSTGCAWP